MNVIYTQLPSPKVYIGKDIYVPKTWHTAFRIIRDSCRTARGGGALRWSRQGWAGWARGGEDLKHPLHRIIYERVVTDYLLERYEKGISGNYKRWRRGPGNFRRSLCASARTSRTTMAMTGCPASAQYYRNPLVFHRPFYTFFFRPLHHYHARVPAPPPYRTPGFPTKVSPSERLSLIPTLCFYCCLFSITQARDYLQSVICFYRHVRTNERFNFTRIKKIIWKITKSLPKDFFQLY